MKSIDIDELAAKIEARRRRRRELGVGLRCVLTEARVVRAMLVEPGVLERCDAVEADDFFFPHHRLIFMAIRAIEADRDAFLDVEAVMAWLERNGYHAVTWFHLGDLVAGTSNYGEHDTVQLARDTTWLRTLANRRKAA